MIYAILAVGAAVLFAIVGRDVLRQIGVRLAWALSPPFAPGDMVRIGAHAGEVVALRWTYVQLRDADGDLVLVRPAPSPDVAATFVAGATAFATRRG